MPNDLILRDVAYELSDRQLRNPVLPFLDVVPSLVRILMFQPRDVVFGDQTRVGVHNRLSLTAQMKGFLQRAHQLNADLALCPEYSCTWSALVESVNDDVFPAAGKLWALACESATADELAAVFAQLAPKVTIVFDDTVLDSGGNFVDPLCYLFRTQRDDGVDIGVVLVQTKTCPMGGHPFESQFLKTGHKIYRFRNTGDQSNSLVGLICSDSLHSAFNAIVLPHLHSNTLVLHPQMNMNPSSEAFRAYRRSCCLNVPRSCEILCLNWSGGTQLLDSGQVVPLVAEPKTILFRDIQQLAEDDVRIIDNHAKGCYLTNWHEHRTAAFVFAPDPHLFYFETSKPFVTGPAPNAIRIGPQMTELFSWDNAAQAWTSSAADDRFTAYWIDANPSLQGVLSGLLPGRLEAERLVQLCTGHAKDMDWPDWKRLPSFLLADDDTAQRLTLCWSNAGTGSVFRQHCLSLFLGFKGVTGNPTLFSNRLIAFKTVDFEIAFKPDVLAKRFRNLHLANGTSATAIYLGQNPGKHKLTEVKSRTLAALDQTESDTELVALWYRDEHGALHDFMDQDIPQINADPKISSVAINNPTP
jgi:hypothetical protein